MKRGIQRLVSVVCALGLTASLLPAAAWADSAPGLPADSADSASATNASSEAPPLLDLDNVEEASLETSAQCQAALAPFALSAEQAVTLAPGRHARWIDRVQVPDYARAFYDTLEEACDNDGYRDFLINDGYFDATAASEGAYRRFGNAGALLIASFTNPSQQTLATAQAAALAVAAAFDRDHPEVFWLNGSVAVAAQGAGSKVEVFLVLRGTDGDGRVRDVRNSSCTSEYAIKHGIWSRDRQVRAILQGLPSGATQEAAVRHFDSWLTHHNQYNTAASAASDNDPWECLSALEGRIGVRGPVCEGYARAFKVLCDRVGIPCVLVDGSAIEPHSLVRGGHMWNYVQLAGAWYAVDVTWDDPSGGPGAVSGDENTAWLLVGGTTVVEGMEFLASHPVENRVYTQGLAFTNGPQLAATDFPRSTATPSISVSLPTVGAEPQLVRLTSLSLSKTSFTFTGKVQKPAVTVRANGRVLPAGTYTVQFSGACKKAGAYRVTVTGKGSYTGRLSATFKIVNPKVAKPTKLKLKAGKKKLAVSWRKAAGKVSGCQVQYSTSKKFTKKTTKKVTVKVTSKLAKKKTLTKTVKKLKAKKTYYVRVRTYYKVGGSTFYSGWTKAKKVRVK